MGSWLLEGRRINKFWVFGDRGLGERILCRLNNYLPRLPLKIDNEEVVKRRKYMSVNIVYDISYQVTILTIVMCGPLYQKSAATF